MYLGLWGGGKSEVEARQKDDSVRLGASQSCNRSTKFPEKTGFHFAVDTESRCDPSNHFYT